jgi:uncharacterized protein Usg
VDYSLIFGSFVTNKELPGDMDVVLVMAEAFKLHEAPRESQTLFSHAEADARFGASVFWVRRGILPDEEMAGFLDFWQTRRDGVMRGIVEVSDRAILGRRRSHVRHSRDRT